MEFCRHRNYVLDGFPQTRKQAKIFCEHFCEPLKLLHLHLDKDEVNNRMTENYKTPAEVQAKTVEFHNWLSVKDDLVGYVQTTGYYQKVCALSDRKSVFKTAMQNFNPSVLMANGEENQELASSVLAKIEQEKGYIHLDFRDVLNCEKRRKTELGLRLIKAFSDNYLPSYELLRQIMFSDPKQNNKFVISNMPPNLQFLESFEQECCPFEFLLYFTAKVGDTPENRATNFNPHLCEIISEYHTTGKLVEIGADT